jgi:VanZ family protein
MRYANWLINHSTAIVRAAAWVGIFAIFVLSVVPAEQRPVSGLGQSYEHFTAFALVGGVFAIAYPLLLTRLLALAVLYCGGIELLQVPLPTRHARVSDFLVDTLGAFVAIVCVAVARKLVRRRRERLRSSAT